MKQLAFYDVECFEKDFLLVIKDINKNILLKSWNDFSELPNILRNYQMVGYNNHYYDDVMITCVMRDMDNEGLKRINDKLIGGQKTPIKPHTYLVDSLDCFQQIAVAKPGLKKIEGNMGHDIEESEVDFNLDRNLTNEEKKLTEHYCEHDVDETIEVYKLRCENDDYFQVKEELLSLLEEDGFDKNKIRKYNTTTLSSMLLARKPLVKWSKLRVNEEFMRKHNIPSDVIEMWLNSNPFIPGEKSITVNMFGCNITFGSGGLHGDTGKPCRFKNVKLKDVASMYPTIVVLFNVLGEYTEKYNEIKKQRVSIKKSNPVKANALKLVLNSVYGQLKSKYSNLYNPYASLTVCVYGQIALFSLCERLYNVGCEIMNINTDGVGYIQHNVPDEVIDQITKEWEEEFKLDLDLDEFDTWIQKDVNNYLAVMPNGKIKAKGGQVNKYLKNQFFNNNDLRIVQIAMCEKLLNDIDPIETITKNLDNPMLYQQVLQCGSTFDGTFDKDNKKYQKVNRIFAVKEKYAHKRLYKRKTKEDGEYSYAEFPDTPPNMKVFNKHCDEYTEFKNEVDLNYYYQLTMSKLEQWM